MPSSPPSPNFSTSDSENTLSRPDLLAGESLPAAPRQMRGVRRYEAVLMAMQTLFAAQGYEATTIEAIAAKADIAVGGFYQTFRSKRQGLLVLMDRLLAELDALEFKPDAGLSLAAAVEGFLRQALEVDFAFIGAYKAWQEAVVTEPGLKDLNQQIMTWTTQRLVLIMGQISAHPKARRGYDIPLVAAMLNQMIWNLLANAAASGNEALIAPAAHIVYHTLFED